MDESVDFILSIIITVEPEASESIRRHDEAIFGQSFFFFCFWTPFIIISKHFSYNRDVDCDRFIENMKETKVFNDTSGSEITLSEKCARIRYNILQKLRCIVHFNVLHVSG